jgi:hypothetical protein
MRPLGRLPSSRVEVTPPAIAASPSTPACIARANLRWQRSIDSRSGHQGASLPMSITTRFRPSSAEVSTSMSGATATRRELLVGIIAGPPRDAVTEPAQAGASLVRDTLADTATPHGRLMLTVLGGLAEFERDLKLGRKPKLTTSRQIRRAAATSQTASPARNWSWAASPAAASCKLLFHDVKESQ